MVNQHDAIKLAERLVVFNDTHCSPQLSLQLIRLKCRLGVLMDLLLA